MPRKVAVDAAAASSSAAGGGGELAAPTGPTTTEIASFLSRQGFALTALELQMELLQNKQKVPSSLTKFIENTLNQPLVQKRPRVNVTSRSHGDELVKQKDEQIARLEYKLRLATEDMQSMKERLDKATRQIVPKTKELAGDQSGAVSDAERRVLNCLVKKYLLEIGYRLTAITLSDEVSDQDLDDLGDVGLADQSSLTLVGLYRHLITQTHTKHNQTLEIDLAVMTQEKKKLESAVSQLQRELQTLTRSSQNEIASLRRKIEAGNLDESAATDLDDSHVVGERQFSGGVYDELERVEMELKKSQATLEECVRTVTDSIPKMKEGLLLKHRDSLIPITLLMIQLHPEAGERDKLTHTLFNLIKRPVPAQSKMIVDGFVRLAAAVGHERTGNELLPQCWEQVSDKHEERRILVADACGALAHFVAPDLRRSLILSILESLASDKSDDVRAAAVKNLSIVVPALPDAEKSATIFQLTIAFAASSAQQISSVLRESLLPCVVEWAISHKLLFSALLPALFDAALEAANASEGVRVDKADEADAEYEGDPIPSSDAQSRTVCLLEAVRSIIPAIISHVFSTSPYIASLQEKSRPEDTSAAILTCVNEGIRGAMRDGKDVCAGWPALRWFAYPFSRFLRDLSGAISVRAAAVFKTHLSLLRAVATNSGLVVSHALLLAPWEAIVRGELSWMTEITDARVELDTRVAEESSVTAPVAAEAVPGKTRRKKKTVAPPAGDSSEVNGSSVGNDASVGANGTPPATTPTGDGPAVGEEEKRKPSRRFLKIVLIPPSEGEIDVGPARAAATGEQRRRRKKGESGDRDRVRPRERLMVSCLSALAGEFEEEEEQPLALAEYLLRRISEKDVSVAGMCWGSIGISLAGLCSGCHKEAAVRMLCALLAKEGESEKIQTVTLYSLRFVMQTAGSLLLSKRIIPAVISFVSSGASHSDSSRMMGLPVLTLTLTLESLDGGVLEKVKEALDSLMDVPPLVPTLCETLGSAIPKARGGVRDLFILPKMNIIAARNNVEAPTPSRRAIANSLWRAYSRFIDAAAGTLAFSQSNEVVTSHLLPGIRLLLNDVEGGMFDAAEADAIHVAEGVILRSLPEDIRNRQVVGAHSTPSKKKGIFAFDKETKDMFHFRKKEDGV